ncbi:MAG: hypothetical protein WBD55_06000 [Dehalococcoidia bacterium]
MRRLSTPLLALALLGAFALAACGDDNGGDETPTVPAVTQAPVTGTPAAIETTELTPGVQDCSAKGMSPAVEEQPELPAPVSVMRQQIVAAAVACDYDALEELALAGSASFSYSFGAIGAAGPGAYWQNAEAQGEEVLANLVKIMNMPLARQNGSYVWPFADVLNFMTLTAKDRAMLEQYFSAEEIANWEQFSGYIGYRATITAGGDWTVFIAGD